MCWTIHFSIKKVSQLVTELGRQVNLWKYLPPVLVIYWLLVVTCFTYLIYFFRLHYGISLPYYCRRSCSHHYCKGKIAYHPFSLPLTKFNFLNSWFCFCHLITNWGQILDIPLLYRCSFKIMNTRLFFLLPFFFFFFGLWSFSGLLFLTVYGIA